MHKTMMQKMTVRTLAALALALVAPGCDDSTQGSGRSDTPDMMMSMQDMGPAPTDAEVMLPRPDGLPSYLGDGGPAVGEPAYVEVSISPRRAFYRRDEAPTLTAVIYDRTAEVLEGVDLVWDVQPPEQADLVMGDSPNQRTLSFHADGASAVRVCVRTQLDLCGRVSVFVDDQAPDLQVETPRRGSVLVGERSILVEGTARDVGDVRVFVNDAPVELSEDGRFSHQIRPNFGLNRIDVVADDGVRRPPSRVVMEVLWTPEVLAVRGDGVDLPEVLALRMAQPFLDTGVAPMPPDEMGVQMIDGLAGLIEAFLSRAEPIRLIDDRVLSEGPPLSLRVENIEPGIPDATLFFTERGIELFLRLENLTVHTAGEVAIEGERFDLGGFVSTTVAAFGVIDIEVGPGGAPRLRVQDVGVAVEGVGGALNDSTAQALLDTFGSLLRQVVEQFAVDLVGDLVREQVPEFIELGLEDVLDTLDVISLDVEAMNGIPAIGLDLGFRLNSPEALNRDSLTLALTGSVNQRGQVEAPHPDPGVPAEGLMRDVPWPVGSGIGVAVQLVVVNALLHEIWRQGILQIDVSAQLPEQFSALVESAWVDGRLPPLVVGTAPGSPEFFQLQVGELDLFVQTTRAEDPDHYVISLRAGLLLQVSGERVAFEIGERPDIRVELVAAGGNRPLLTPDALGRLLEELIWPEISGALAGGLEVDLPATVIGADAFQGLAPDISAIELGVEFPGEPLVRAGWFVLGADLGITIR